MTVLATLAGAAVLAGCAGLAARPAEDVVRERAQARWNLLLAGKLDEAYAYLSPASRVVVSPQRFRSSFGGVVSWQSAEVHKVECKQTDRCTVSITVRYRPLLRGGSLSNIETSVEEIWLHDGGQWWLPQGL